MKAASLRARTRKFLTFAATSLTAVLAFGTPITHADDSAYPQGYPKLGVRTESVPDYNLKYPGAGYHNIPTMLLSVHTSSSKEGNIKAYCIELEVNIQLKSSLKVGG